MDAGRKVLSGGTPTLDLSVWVPDGHFANASHLTCRQGSKRRGGCGLSGSQRARRQLSGRPVSNNVGKAAAICLFFMS